MGLAYILWIYDDGIRDSKHEPRKYRDAVGDAVLQVCRSSQWAKVPTSAPVLNHSNCVNVAGEQQSTWEQVYFWSQNCLRSARTLSADELLTARRIIDEELDSRKKPDA